MKWPLLFAAATSMLISSAIPSLGQESALPQSIAEIEKLSDNKSAIGAYQKRLLQARAQKDDADVISILDHLGKRYFNAGNTEAMIRCENEALGISRQHKALYNRKAVILNNLGICYQSAGKYDSSLLVYQQAIQAQDSFGSRIARSIPYLNMGLLYYRLRRYGPAEDALKKSLAIAEKDGDTRMIAAAYLNLGSQYAGAIPVDSIHVAERYLKKAIAIGEKQNYTDVLSKGFYALGLLSQKLADTTEAIAFYRKALAHPMGIAYDDLIPLLNLGQIYFGRKQYSEAESLFRKGLLKALQQSPPPDYIIDFYYYLAAIFRTTGRYKEAARYYETYIGLSDSLRGPATSDKVSELEAQFKASEHSRQVIGKELKIQQQQAVIFRDRILLSSLVIGILLLSLAGIFLLRFRKERQKKMHEIALRTATLKGEETERGRIAGELHNNVAAVLGTARGWLGSIKKQMLPAGAEPDFQGALGLLDTAIDDVRATAHALTPELLLHQGLPRALEIFAKQLGKAKGIRIVYYYLGCIQDIDKGMELMLFRTTQELLQNAINHSGTENILLQLSCHDTLLSITVEDRGKGMESSQYGFGLSFVQKNIEQLGGRFYLESKPGKYTSVVIEINYRQNLPL